MDQLGAAVEAGDRSPVAHLRPALGAGPVLHRGQGQYCTLLYYTVLYCDPGPAPLHQGRLLAHVLGDQQPRHRDADQVTNHSTPAGHVTTQLTSDWLQVLREGEGEV